MTLMRLCRPAVAVAAIVACCGVACADPIRECAQILEADIRDGVIHGAAAVADGLEGETLSGSWGWADTAHTVSMTTRTAIDIASVTKAAPNATVLRK